MNKLLVLSAMGADKPGIVKALSKAVADCEGNISESRMAVLGGEFAVIMLVSAAEANLARLEEHLPQLERELGLHLFGKRTQTREAGATAVPYRVEVIAMDHPGIVHEVTDFFARHDVNIETLETSNYAAPHTGTMMFSLEMEVGVPTGANATSLRREFLDFCEGLNLDASIELLRSR